MPEIIIKYQGERCGTDFISKVNTFLKGQIYKPKEIIAEEIITECQIKTEYYPASKLGKIVCTFPPNVSFPGENKLDRIFEGLIEISNTPTEDQVGTYAIKIKEIRSIDQGRKEHHS